MAQRNPFMVSVMEKPQTNDSFQHELEDFIRKQRARGLHPRTYFRNMAEESFHQERDCVSPGAPMLGPPLSSGKHPTSCTSYERPTVEDLVPHCRRRLESLKYPQKNQPISQDGKKSPGHQEWGGATSVEQGTPKRKHHRERASRKEDDGGLTRRKASAEPAGTEKSKPRKRTRHDGRDPSRSRRQSHREKKEPEERDLWDEAILGSCD